MEEKEQVVAKRGKKNLEDTSISAQSQDLVATLNGQDTLTPMPLLPTPASMDEKTWSLLVAKAKAIAELTSTLASLSPVGMKFTLSPYIPRGVSGRTALMIMVIDDTYDLGKVVSGKFTETTIAGLSGLDILKQNATKSESQGENPVMSTKGYDK